VEIRAVKRSITLDDDLARDIDQAAALIREDVSTVIRLAVRAGLATVVNRFQAPRPDGFFADAYKEPSRAQFEDQMAKAIIQRPER
jgi:hypothetical protein